MQHDNEDRDDGDGDGDGDDADTYADGNGYADEVAKVRMEWTQE
jgi:hypothetical protein